MDEPEETTTEQVDDTAPEARETLAHLDETVAFLAGEMLGGDDDV
jgi:NifB/MoaA-like Fe-S oxidoreductase